MTLDQILISISLVINIFTLYKLFRFNKELKSIPRISVKEYSYDSDKLLKHLNDCINSELNFVLNNLLNSFQNKRSEGILSDEDITEICATITNNVKDKLSKNYVNVLSLYINDIDDYISQKVYFVVVPIVLEHNQKKIQQV